MIDKEVQKIIRNLELDPNNLELKYTSIDLLLRHGAIREAFKILKSEINNRRINFLLNKGLMKRYVLENYFDKAYRTTECFGGCNLIYYLTGCNIEGEESFNMQKDGSYVERECAYNLLKKFEVFKKEDTLEEVFESLGESEYLKERIIDTDSLLSQRIRILKNYARKIKSMKAYLRMNKLSQGVLDYRLIEYIERHNLKGEIVKDSLNNLGNFRMRDFRVFGGADGLDLSGQEFVDSMLYRVRNKKLIEVVRKYN